ncbi:MAG TPA: hypothetical protein VGD37_31480 [Kofleriaceae bacterium]
MRSRALPPATREVQRAGCGAARLASARGRRTPPDVYAAAIDDAVRSARVRAPRVKKGKTELYLKNEGALEDDLLDSVCRDPAVAALSSWARSQLHRNALTFGQRFPVRRDR